jgi:hypothetical protein
MCIQILSSLSYIQSPKIIHIHFCTVLTLLLAGAVVVVGAAWLVVVISAARIVVALTVRGAIWA